MAASAEKARACADSLPDAQALAASANVMDQHALLWLSRGLSGEANSAIVHNGQGKKLLKAVVRSHRGGGERSRLKQELERANARPAPSREE
jgi:hypothetical protein